MIIDNHFHRIISNFGYRLRALQQNDLPPSNFSCYLPLGLCTASSMPSHVWIQGWKLFYRYFVWKLLNLSGKREQDPGACASEKKVTALCHKTRQESKDWVLEKQEFCNLFLPLFKWGQHHGRNQSIGSPTLCESTYGWRPPNQRWTSREPLCLSSHTLCVPSISTSRRKPATTQIEAQEIRRSLEIKRHNKSHIISTTILSLLRYASPRPSTPVQRCWWSNHWKTAGER